MLNENPPLGRRLRSYWTARPLLTATLAGTLVVLSTVGAIQVSASASRDARELSESTVNHTLKGDRSIVIRMVQTIRFPAFDVRNEAIVDAELAAGCEPFVSDLADVELARVARHCVS